MADNNNGNNPNNLNVTSFEEWLAAQSNLTAEQRQALVDHNADATVTFSAESFDRYLDELRNAPDSNTPPAQPNNSEQAFTAEEYQAAIDLTKGDLSRLNFEEVKAAWNVLGQLDDKIAQATRPEALQAKLKMADFAETQMASVNPEQPWSMENAPEYSEWLSVSNDIQEKNTNQEKKDRNAKIGTSLNTFYQGFDEEYGLSNLTPENSQFIADNEQAIEAIGKDFNPFAKNDKGEYQHPLFADIEKFYDKVEIDNTNKNVDTVDKEEYKKQMAELAYNEVVLELSLNPDFAKLSKEQQQQLLTESYASHMQAGIVNLIATQMAENNNKADPEHQKKPEEFTAQASGFIGAAINGENNTFKVSNTVALSTLASRTTVVSQVAKRVAQKTGHKSFWSKIKDFDKRLAKKYPKAYPFLKNLAISSAIGLTTGGVGLTVMSAYKSGKAIYSSYKNYKEINKDGQYKSWFNYLGKNPKEAIGLSVSVLGTAMSGYMVGLDGINVNDFGLGGQVYQNGLGNTWDMMKHTVGNAFSSSEAVKDQPWTDRFMSWGKRFGEQVANTTHDGNRMVRMGISLSGGISTGAIDFIASFREKDPEKRKQLRKNAWKSFGGVVTGSLMSLGFTAFMKANNPDSPLPHDAPIDGDDTKPGVIHHDKPIGPEPYHPGTPRHDLTPDHPSHGHNPAPHNPMPHIKAPDMPEMKTPDLSHMAKPVDMPTHLDPINPNHFPQTDNEQALFEELRRGHNIGAEDSALAQAAAIKDFNHYMELKEHGNFAEADKFLGQRHQQFENAEHHSSNQVSDNDSRHVAHVKADADKAYSDYKAALSDLKNNPDSPEAQATFDKAAYEMAKADVDKTEAIVKHEIKGLNQSIETDRGHLDKVGLQREAYEQEHGSLKHIDSQLTKMGVDPAHLPEDVSQLSPEAQELVSHHNRLNDYQKVEDGLNKRIEGNQQEIIARKDILHDLHSQNENTAGEAVNKHVAGYENYEGSRLRDLNEKIAVESSASQDNQPADSQQAAAAGDNTAGDNKEVSEPPVSVQEVNANKDVSAYVEEVQKQFISNNEAFHSYDKFQSHDGTEHLTKYYGYHSKMDVYEYTQGDTQAKVVQDDILTGSKSETFNRDGSRSVTTIDVYGQKTVQSFDAEGKIVSQETAADNHTAKTPEQRLEYRTNKLDGLVKSGQIDENLKQEILKNDETQQRLTEAKDRMAEIRGGSAQSEVSQNTAADTASRPAANTSGRNHTGYVAGR